MGCDIHFLVEKNINGKWTQIKGFGNCFSEDSESPYEDRNYEVFALLADVRNRHSIEPMSELRGVPANASDTVRNYMDGGLHSVSHYILNELLDYDYKNTIVKRSGYVTLDGYRQFKDMGKPQSWCQGTTSDIVNHCKMDEQLKIVDSGTEQWGYSYTFVQWNEPMDKVVGSFYTSTLKQLKDRSDKKDYSDIRVILGFDS